MRVQAKHLREGGGGCMRGMNIVKFYLQELTAPAMESEGGE